jgi:DNA-binding transcriptional MerR regulator
MNMLINEASKKTRLTKKAIEYYAEQNLISPAVLENGYREFTQTDVESLRKIAVLRKVGLGIQDIKAVLSDDSGDVLRKITVQRELHMQQEQAKKSILDDLCHGKSYSEIIGQLESIEQSATITEKLLEQFPGYYGQFISLHFSRFLNQPITTAEQRQALDEIITFLDNMPVLVFPEDVQALLDENTREYSIEAINTMLAKTKQSIENIGEFLSDNESFLKEWMAYKQSDEYKNSPLYKAETLLKEFNSTSGYYDTFIPAMKKLSNSYAEYIQQAEAANEELLSRYPDLSR